MRRRLRRHAVFAQTRRRVEAAQRLAPELLGRAQVLSTQPFNVVSVRPRRRQVWLLAPRKCVVATEDFFDDDRVRPAVERDVVAAPDELVRLFGKPEESQTEQWRLRKVEAAPAVLTQVFVQPRTLLDARKRTPVSLLPG